MRKRANWIAPCSFSQSKRFLHAVLLVLQASILVVVGLVAVAAVVAVVALVAVAAVVAVVRGSQAALFVVKLEYPFSSLARGLGDSSKLQR